MFALIFSLSLMSGYIKIMVSSRWVVSRYPYHILLVGVKKYGYFLDFYLVENGILGIIKTVFRGQNLMG